MEGDYIQLWCTIEYNGNWLPVTEQNRSGNRKTDSASSSISTSLTSTTITPSIRIQLTSSDNGVTITWKTSFKPTSTMRSTTRKPGEAVAVNVPQYQHLWDIKTSVLCKYELLCMVELSQYFPHDKCLFSKDLINIAYLN